MLLPERTWKPSLATSDDQLIADFFLPALASSVRYDRGVGFFSSAWVRVAAKGMMAFADNGGRARWITSPILDEDDWDALLAGHEARTDSTLREAIQRNVQNLAEALEEDTRNALAWMVADEVIDFRLALPVDRLNGGEFHDKFGVFTDSAENQIAFNGSYNDSIQGLRNYESLKVFVSWEEPLKSFVRSDVERFEKLWTGNDPHVRVFPLPDAAREDILKLRTGPRPYRPPPWVRAHSGSPAVPAFMPPRGFEIRWYQKRAIQKWLDNNGRGILALATGAGKTKTSLYLGTKVAEKISPLVLVVVVPYVNLARQWERDMRDFGLQPVGCFEGRAKWQEPLQVALAALLAGVTKVVAIIVTNRTFLSEEFRGMLPLGRVRHLLIADEVHNLGAEQLQRRLDPRVDFRLGLSATPERHGDVDGTQELKRYFGDIVDEFSLKDAIAEKVLCPYLYFPVLVDLTDDEALEYRDLTLAISRYAGHDDGDGMPEALKMLLMKRARLLASAQNKIPALQSTLRGLGTRPERAIVYCGDGRVEAADDSTMRQVDAVQRMLGLEEHLRVHKFTCDEGPEEREQMLRALRSGRLDALVAIRCLDEGIDVPDIRQAFILASSTNPRQFIQRRGRLLRPAPGKRRAQVWDFIVRPPDLGGQVSDAAFNMERRLFKRELERIVEFCDTAENGPAALNLLIELRKTYNLLS